MLQILCHDIPLETKGQYYSNTILCDLQTYIPYETKRQCCLNVTLHNLCTCVSYETRSQCCFNVTFYNYVWSWHLSQIYVTFYVTSVVILTQNMIILLNLVIFLMPEPHPDCFTTFTHVTIFFPAVSHRDAKGGVSWAWPSVFDNIGMRMGCNKHTWILD